MGMFDSISKAKALLALLVQWIIAVQRVLDKLSPADAAELDQLHKLVDDIKKISDGLK